MYIKIHILHLKYLLTILMDNFASHDVT